MPALVIPETVRDIASGSLQEAVLPPDQRRRIGRTRPISRLVTGHREPDVGYRRIREELKKVGAEISATSVRRILADQDGLCNARSDGLCRGHDGRDAGDRVRQPHRPEAKSGSHVAW